MTKATDLAAAAAAVNQDTALLLADPEVNKHISKPADAGEGTYNPLAASKTSGPLDYYPTLESRDIPKNTPADGNEIGEVQESTASKKAKGSKAAAKVPDETKAAIVSEANDGNTATPDSSLKPGDSKTPNVQHSDAEVVTDEHGEVKVEQKD